MRAREIEAGERIQIENGVEVRPMDDQNAGDFVDVNGKTYDAMGMPEVYINWGDGSQFLKSIDSHLTKSVDSVVIDLTGATLEQIGQILDHISVSGSPNVDNLIFVGG